MKKMKKMEKMKVLGFCSLSALLLDSVILRSGRWNKRTSGSSELCFLKTRLKRKFISFQTLKNL